MALERNYRAERTERAEKTKFVISDTVQWSSQAQGSWKTKTGTIVDVVPAKKVTQMMRSLGLGGYNSRDHESYIVHVPTKSGRGRGTYYWPVVSGLKKVF